MASDTTIGCNQATKDRLAAMKRDGETWDDTLNRVLDTAEEEMDVAQQLARIDDRIDRLPERLGTDLEQRFNK